MYLLNRLHYKNSVFYPLNHYFIPKNTIPDKKDLAGLFLPTGYFYPHLSLIRCDSSGSALMRPISSATICLTSLLMR